MPTNSRKPSDGIHHHPLLLTGERAWQASLRVRQAREALEAAIEAQAKADAIHRFSIRRDLHSSDAETREMAQRVATFWDVPLDSPNPMPRRRDHGIRLEKMRTVDGRNEITTGS